MIKKLFNKRIRASLTVEAALGLSLFVFAVICLIMPLKMLDTQRRVQMVTEAFAKELSQYAYIRYRMLKGETIDPAHAEAGNGGGDMPGSVTELFGQAAAEVYLRRKIGAAVKAGSVTGLDFSRMVLSEDGGTIDIYAAYRMKLPFKVFALDSVPAVSRSLRRGWIGSPGARWKGQEEGEDGEVMVYVGKNMSRYHWFADCHYISNDISEVSFDAVSSLKNDQGKHYKPCSVCGKSAGPGSTVYILPGGKYYHSSRNCSSLAFYVRKVPLSEVEYLGECSYCKKKKGTK